MNKLFQKNLILLFVFIVGIIDSPAQQQAFAFQKAIGNKSSPEFINKLKFVFDDAGNKPYIVAPYISAVINDPTDPAATTGIRCLIQNNGAALDASDYSIDAFSSDTAIVKNKDVSITKFNGAVIIKINASGIGYSDVTLTLTASSSTKNLVINYAASAAAFNTSNTWWHTGNSDASAVLLLDSGYMVTGDDELNYLYVFNRHHSGLPVQSFYYGDKLELVDGAPNYREVDAEACTASPTIKGRSYWLGSMSNSRTFKDKPNRNRLFAVDIKHTGTAAQFSFAGYCDNLKTALLKWGDDNGYKLRKSAAEGRDPKAIDGFNAEGLVFAPDGTTLWIGLRAPLLPVSERTKALIAPVLNFETWFNNGRPKQKPVLGQPIQLDLGGRGIRDMIRLSNGVYLIVAGSYNQLPDGAIYKWSGNISDSATRINEFNIKNYNGEAVTEVDDEQGNIDLTKLQLLRDNGNDVFYGDGIPAKLVEPKNFSKFNSEIIFAGKAVLNNDTHK